MKFLKQKIKIYNTKTKKKEIFNSIKFGFIGMYVCGPTVYKKIHLGNLRTFLSFDLINRYFRFLNYKVRYVRNITDAGHITDNSGNDIDQIGNQSKLEQIEPMEIVQKYTIYFHQIMNQFNILPPDIEPTATGHISEQIELIKKLIKKKFAYVVNGSVYFNIMQYNKKNSYGELNKRKIKEIPIHTREIIGKNEKKHPWDFALWKRVQDEHLQKWNSPWGVGVPGWHIECTAMSTKYLGDIFDIHGGGIDLKFPHHECEIAQGIGYSEKNPVNYWIHANLLTINGEKMSKTKKNIISPDQITSTSNLLFEKKFNPNTIKFFFYQAHYRSILNISNNGLITAEKGFHRLNEGINLLKIIPISNKTSFDIKKHIQSLYDSMNDDFNSSILISNLFEIVKIIKKIKLGIETINQQDYEILKIEIYGFFYQVLGFKIKPHYYSNENFHKIIKTIISIRNKLRLEKKWKTSDNIRNELEKNGIKIMDNKNETIYKIKI